MLEGEGWSTLAGELRRPVADSFPTAGVISSAAFEGKRLLCKSDWSAGGLWSHCCLAGGLGRSTSIKFSSLITKLQFLH